MMRFLIIAVFICCFSMACVSDVDFNQVDDIEIYTDHNASLLYFDLDANDFLDDLNNETLVISDTVRIPVFSGPYTENFLIQADFLYKLTNTFSRSITIEYNFLDEFDNALYIFDPIVLAPDVNDIEVVQTILEPEIPSVLQTDKIVLRITMSSSGGILDPSLNETLNVESAVLLHYRVTVEDD